MMSSDAFSLAPTVSTHRLALVPSLSHTRATRAPTLASTSHDACETCRITGSPGGGVYVYGLPGATAAPQNMAAAALAAEPATAAAAAHPARALQPSSPPPNTHTFPEDAVWRGPAVIAHAFPSPPPLHPPLRPHPRIPSFPCPPSRPPARARGGRAGGCFGGCRCAQHARDAAITFHLTTHPHDTMTMT